MKRITFLLFFLYCTNAIAQPVPAETNYSCISFLMDSTTSVLNSDSLTDYSFTMPAPPKYLKLIRFDLAKWYLPLKPEWKKQGRHFKLNYVVQKDNCKCMFIINNLILTGYFIDISKVDWCIYDNQTLQINVIDPHLGRYGVFEYDAPYRQRTIEVRHRDGKIMDFHGGYDLTFVLINKIAMRKRK